jgi:hypothetical protein
VGFFDQRRVRVQTNGGGRRGPEVRVTFDGASREEWSFDQSTRAATDEHPVTQFRRMAAETTARIDAALVAIHGEPEPERQGDNGERLEGGVQVETCADRHPGTSECVTAADWLAAHPHGIHPAKNTTEPARPDWLHAPGL